MFRLVCDESSLSVMQSRIRASHNSLKSDWEHLGIHISNLCSAASLQISLAFYNIFPPCLTTIMWLTVHSLPNSYLVRDMAARWAGFGFHYEIRVLKDRCQILIWGSCQKQLRQDAGYTGGTTPAWWPTGKLSDIIDNSSTVWTASP